MMSGSRGSGAMIGGGSQPIPAASRKMVQSLKEIVNCSDAEIYAALKECNMDPNEAVNRLISQDPFHEVKSKREKKKEGKDGTDFRIRNNYSSRANKVGAERYVGRGSSTPYNSCAEPSSFPGKSSYKKENGLIPHVTSGSSRSRGSAGYSAGAESKGSLSGRNDTAPSAGIKPSSGSQPTWGGAPSVADIVKMGKTHNRPSNDNVLAPSTGVPQDPDSGISAVHNIPSGEEWPVKEKAAATKAISIPEGSVHSVKDLEVPSDNFNLHSETEEDADDTAVENNETSGVNDTESDFISCGRTLGDDSRGASMFETDLYSYQNQARETRSDEEIVASVPSVTRNFQQLNVEKNDRELPSEVHQPSVVFPNHLQVQDADCSHLSFGSFGSGMGASYSSGTVASIPVKSNLEEVHADANVASVLPLDTRSSEHHVDDSIGIASDAVLFQRVGGAAESYGTPSVSQPEELTRDNVLLAHRNPYHFPSPNPGYAFDDSKHLNSSLSQTSSSMQNISPFSAMQSYTNPLPSALSSANAHPGRESDIQYSSFPVSLSMAAKFANSSLGGSASSMSEDLKSAGLAPTQPSAHTLSGANVAPGPPLPPHLTANPYSQPSLPLGLYMNMLGYPFLPQSYAYMPSAFQQAFAGNSSYHQSLAALLPQYKNNVAESSLPQSAAAFGYGAAFGNTTTAGNFPMNAPAAPSAGSSLNYDDSLTSHYKDAGNLVAHQQGDNSAAMWLQGPNSRTMSAVPASAYYNYQGPNQQSGEFRQVQQQLSQNHDSLGYPNLFHAQTGASTDLHQNLRDGSQGQPKPPQIWQNGH